MAGHPDRIIVPIIPLARDAVLLPGVSLRIPIAKRSDIPPLLTAVYSEATKFKREPSSIMIGCVPLGSPLLSPEGQNLIEDSESRVRKTAEHLALNPSGAGEKDLFGYGTVARISGVQGRRPGDLSLIVEGVRRFRVERFTQFKPYIECQITPLGEESEYLYEVVTWPSTDSA